MFSDIILQLQVNTADRKNNVSLCPSLLSFIHHGLSHLLSFDFLQPTDAQSDARSFLTEEMIAGQSFCVTQQIEPLDCAWSGSSTDFYPNLLGFVLLQTESSSTIIDRLLNLCWTFTDVVTSCF